MVSSQYSEIEAAINMNTPEVNITKDDQSLSVRALTVAYESIPSTTGQCLEDIVKSGSTHCPE